MSSSASVARRHGRWVTLAVFPILASGCGGGPDPVGAAAPPPEIAAPVERTVATRLETLAETSAKASAKTPAEAPAEAAVRGAGWAGAAAAGPRGDVARPTRILIPRLGIDAAVDPLYLNRKRVLVPPRYGRAGWYKAGPEPGEAGRAVVAGHVDSKTGPDVFAALDRARKGDRILVRLADGSTVRFAVERVEKHPQSDFPSARVYGGPKRHAELRLITCTGAYDRARGRYLDNLIVFATLMR